MKTLFSILVILGFAFRLSAGDTNAPASSKTDASVPLKIGTGQADQYYGREMIVTGTVAQVTIRPKVKFLNLDQPFPNSPFTVVIFPGTFIPDVEGLKGKAIEVKGRIKNFHDKPEIALDSTNQLTILGSTISTNSMISTNAPAIPQPTNAPPSLEATNLTEIL